jgi:hypothetical protein
LKVAFSVASVAEAGMGDAIFNELPALLRKWFGPAAGLPIASFEVPFQREGNAGSWRLPR